MAVPLFNANGRLLFCNGVLAASCCGDCPHHWRLVGHELVDSGTNWCVHSYRFTVSLIICTQRGDAQGAASAAQVALRWITDTNSDSGDPEKPCGGCSGRNLWLFNFRDSTGIPDTNRFRVRFGVEDCPTTQDLNYDDGVLTLTMERID